MKVCTPLVLLRPLIVTFFAVVAPLTKAADELLVYAFASGGPAVGAEVFIGETSVGFTGADGSLLADLSGAGARTVSVETASGSVSARFSAGGGQLVDAIAQLDEGTLYVDVYSQAESVAELKAAPEGTLTIAVKRGGEPVADETVFVAGAGSSVVTDAKGLATLSLPRGRYRTQVAEQVAYLRVVGGLTRQVVVSIAEDGEAMQVAAPDLEEVFVVASFDPSGLEVSERDASNIVDTIGVELLTRFSDSDVAASVVRVPGISVQDDKYVFIRGLGGRYISSTLNGATMPSTHPS